MLLRISYAQQLSNIMLPGFLLLCVLGSAQAQQETPHERKVWTTVGSAGTLDKGDISKVTLDNSVVQLGVGLAGNLPLQHNFAQDPAALGPRTESAVVRYNVTPVDGLFDPPKIGTQAFKFSIQLHVRYLAANAQVIAKLIEVDLATGVERVRLIFDSSHFAPSNGYHVNFVDNCRLFHSGGPFDFERKAYYIQGTLRHNPLLVGSAAGIQIIKIVTRDCLE